MFPVKHELWLLCRSTSKLLLELKRIAKQFNLNVVVCFSSLHFRKFRFVSLWIPRGMGQVFNMTNKKMSRQTGFCFFFASIISCCCFERTSSRLMQPPVSAQTNSQRKNTTLHITIRSAGPASSPTLLGLMETYAIARLRRSSSKAASSASASAQPIRHHKTSINSENDDLNSSETTLMKCDSLFWISLLFLGFGGMTVKALLLEQETQTLYFTSHDFLNTNTEYEKKKWISNLLME